MKICIISPGLVERNRFVQPWRYLIQGTQALQQCGHQVYFLSDGYPHLPKEGEFAGYTVKRINTLKEWPLLENKYLVCMVNEGHPDLVLWNLGLTSFLRLNTFRHISAPVIGIFTSPIYRPSELLHLSILRLFSNHELSKILLLGLLVPSITIRRAVKQGPIHKLATECETTRARLLQKGISTDQLQVIKPYINPVWFQRRPINSNNIQVREDYGFSRDDFVVGYFGASAPLRGLPALILAVKLAIQKEPYIRLLVLSRVLHEGNRLDNSNILRMIKENKLERQICFVPGMLSEERLIQSLSICDAIALPFELIPSDVPISILETMALGIPLITTNTACLPEMVPDGTGIHVPPGDSTLLAEAILTLSSDPQLRENLSKKGREQSLSWNSIEASNRAWNNLVLSYEARSS